MPTPTPIPAFPATAVKGCSTYCSKGPGHLGRNVSTSVVALIIFFDSSIKCLSQALVLQPRRAGTLSYSSDGLRPQHHARNVVDAHSMFAY